MLEKPFTQINYVRSLKKGRNKPPCSYCDRFYVCRDDKEECQAFYEFTVTGSFKRKNIKNKIRHCTKEREDEERG